jgi:hypothetical protein
MTPPLFGDFLNPDEPVYEELSDWEAVKKSVIVCIWHFLSPCPLSLTVLFSSRHWMSTMLSQGTCPWILCFSKMPWNTFAEFTAFCGNHEAMLYWWELEEVDEKVSPSSLHLWQIVIFSKLKYERTSVSMNSARNLRNCIQLLHLIVP